MTAQIILKAAPEAPSGGWLPDAVAQINVSADGEIIASLLLFDNPGIYYRDMPAMLFGRLRLPANEKACSLLLRTAEDVVRSLDKAVLLGPVNGSTWQEYRLPLQGDAPLFTGDSALPAQWAAILEQAGYEQADIYYSSVASVRQISAAALPDDITMRLITSGSLSADLRLLYPLCMRAFSGAAYFTPISREAFAEQYEGGRPLLQSCLSYIALRDNTAIAFVLAYPDILHPADKRLVVKTIARDPDVNIPGLVDNLQNTMYSSAAAQGLTQAIHAFMHSAARSVNRSGEWGGKPLRSYALFSKIFLPDA